MREILIAITLTRQSLSASSWIASGNIARTDSPMMLVLAGAKTTSAELDRVGIVTADVFDGGTVGLTYEF